MATPSIAPPSASNRFLDLEQEVIDWTENLYDLSVGSKEREAELASTFKILDYLKGKQWSESARYARSKPVLNKMRRHYWENVALLTDLALDFQVKLFDGMDNYSELQTTLNSLAVHWAQQHNFDAGLHDVVNYGLLHTGYAKMQWNSSLNGGMGDVQMIPIAPWQIAHVGAENDPKEAECVIYFKPVTLEALVRQYGETAKRVKADDDYTQGNLEIGRPRHISKESWSRAGAGLKRLIGQVSTTSNESPYQIATKKEFWLNDDSVNSGNETIVVGPQDASGKPKYNWCYYAEPGERLYPRGRVIITASGCVLEDAPNPYWHAQKPFPSFRPFRVPWQLSGDSTCAPWIQLANITNRIMGGVLDHIKSVLEPTLIAPKAAFPAADWDALDPGAAGGKIKYNNNSPKAPEFAKRSEFPGGWVFQYLGEISKEWAMSSGAEGVNQALGKKQVPGDDALERIVNSRTLPVKVQSRALESFVEDVGGMGIANMLQFYSVSHRVAILGSKGITSSDFNPIYGEMLPKGMKPEEFVRKAQLVIKPGNLLVSDKNERISFALNLVKMGQLSSRNLFRILDNNLDFEKNRQELLAEAKDKLLIAAAAAALSGKGKGK